MFLSRFLPLTGGPDATDPVLSQISENLVPASIQATADPQRTHQHSSRDGGGQEAQDNVLNSWKTQAFFNRPSKTDGDRNLKSICMISKIRHMKECNWKNVQVNTPQYRRFCRTGFRACIVEIVCALLSCSDRLVELWGKYILLLCSELYLSASHAKHARHPFLFLFLRKYYNNIGKQNKCSVYGVIPSVVLYLGYRQLMRAVVA